MTIREDAFVEDVEEDGKLYSVSWDVEWGDCAPGHALLVKRIDDWALENEPLKKREASE